MDRLDNQSLATAAQLTGALKRVHKNGIAISADIKALIESIPSSGKFIDSGDIEREHVSTKLQKRQAELFNLDSQLRAPELLLDGIESRAADTFYVAALFCYLCTGQLAQNHPQDRHAWLQFAMSHTFDLMPLSPMLMKMLSPEPNDRPQSFLAYDLFEDAYLQAIYGKLNLTELEVMLKRFLDEGQTITASGEPAPERHFRLMQWLMARTEDLEKITI
ncbi:hypothetical protein BH10CYA1_BH10CYA1_32700 [soil metagenome]